MIDPHNALRAFLIATSPLRTLLGGNHVYTPELPETRMGDTKNVTFRVEGGQSGPYPRSQNLRVVFRCWGESAEDAREVYRALYDRLHDRQNFIVNGVGFYGADEEVPGTPLEDPATNWPFIHTVFTVKVATISIPSA
jgi:hypothetical protein